MARYQINKQVEVSIHATNVFDRRYRYSSTTNAPTMASHGGWR